MTDKKRWSKPMANTSKKRRKHIEVTANKCGSSSTSQTRQKIRAKGNV